MWTVPSESLLLLRVLSDWLGMAGGGEWAVGVACQRWRGCWEVAGEGLTWKRPTVKAGVFFFPNGQKERVSVAPAGGARQNTGHQSHNHHY